MDLGSIFLILAVLIPVAVFIARPLMERKFVSLKENAPDLSTLLAERDQIVATVKELDDDFNLGKIPSEVYPSQRLLLLEKGAEVLRQIDAFQGAPSTSTMQARLEVASIGSPVAPDGARPAARKNGNAVPPVPDDDLEQKIAVRRRLNQGKAGGFCPKCGKPVQSTDRFCPKCGATLA